MNNVYRSCYVAGHVTNHLYIVQMHFMAVDQWNLSDPRFEAIATSSILKCNKVYVDNSGYKSGNYPSTQSDNSTTSLIQSGNPPSPISKEV